MSDHGTANCIFCKIISGAIPSPRVDEDDSFICIRDIQPQAPTHLLVVPKTHVIDVTAADAALVGEMFEFGVRVARKQGLLPGGFRSMINTGVNGGQTVFHLHLHLLA
jgi:histidine triad (HIT) family protein